MLAKLVNGPTLSLEKLKKAYRWCSDEISSASKLVSLGHTAWIAV